MKLLFVEEDYNLFFTKYFDQHPEFRNLNYEDQVKFIADLNYYKVGSYFKSFRKLGMQTSMALMECNPLQYSWISENSFFLKMLWHLDKPLRSFRFRVLKQDRPYYHIRKKVLLEQVERLKPDVICFHSGIFLDHAFMYLLKKKVKKIVLQWNCELLEGYPYSEYDAIFTSVSKLQSYFRKEAGVKSFLIQQAFDEEILQSLPGIPSTLGDTVFIGSFNEEIHQNRISLIQYLADHTSIDIYAPEVNAFRNNGNVQRQFKGNAGGTEMYSVYRKYKIALHIPMQMSQDKSSDEAGAKRLFEVTGVGVMLLCSHQSNLSDYFKIGKEIVTFTDKEDCLQKMNYYLSHPEEREAIAKAGQRRTLRDHTISKRSTEFLAHIYFG